jgi:hypothetical protein
MLSGRVMLPDEAPSPAPAKELPVEIKTKNPQDTTVPKRRKISAIIG